MYANTLAYNGVQTIHITEAVAGDAVFCHSTGFVGRAIRLGQRIRGYGEYGIWNHVAWLDRPVRDEAGNITDWYVGQAIARGVDDQHLLSTVAPHGGDYEIVPIESFPAMLGDGSQVDRRLVLATLRAQIGERYGFLTILSIIVNILTPKFVRIDFRRAGTFICSGLYAYALHGGGGKVPGDLYQNLPAEVAAIAVK